MDTPSNPLKATEESKRKFTLLDRWHEHISDLTVEERRKLAVGWVLWNILKSSLLVEERTPTNRLTPALKRLDRTFLLPDIRSKLEINPPRQRQGAPAHLRQDDDQCVLYISCPFEESLDPDDCIRAHRGLYCVRSISIDNILPVEQSISPQNSLHADCALQDGPPRDAVQRVQQYAYYQTLAQAIMRRL